VRDLSPTLPKPTHVVASAQARQLVLEQRLHFPPCQAVWLDWRVGPEFASRSPGADPRWQSEYQREVEDRFVHAIPQMLQDVMTAA